MMATNADVDDQKINVVYYLRDLNKEIVSAWENAFSKYKDSVKVSRGDIFEGAPGVDAIVSPANSFGFMDGGIDMAYSQHFGWQMQERLQTLLQEKFHGELPVGQAVIIPAYGSAGRDPSVDWCRFNHGETIEYLISAPTMRVPEVVKETANAYLAFRAVILAVEEHNSNKQDINPFKPIKRVLVPGLATMVGRMPAKRCAYQMLQAYETFVEGKHNFRRKPKKLGDMFNDHETMSVK
ncbi:unnamed protein product [Lymnaea stagnalis]|uniref:Macro domain-containing protein n=1 Tax=Lymnaea stagnalis TaxID=6523 RepID=A0AAV2HKD3_LYMST